MTCRRGLRNRDQQLGQFSTLASLLGAPRSRSCYICYQLYWKTIARLTSKQTLDAKLNRLGLVVIHRFEAIYQVG